MFVCLCSGITDTQITGYLEQHPDASFKMLQSNLGVASNCGKCAEYILDMMPMQAKIMHLNQDVPYYDLMSSS